MVDFKVFFSLLFFQNIHFNDPTIAKNFQDGIFGLVKISLFLSLLFLILGKGIQYMAKKGIVYDNGTEVYLFIGAIGFFSGYVLSLILAYLTAMAEKDTKPDSNRE